MRQDTKHHQAKISKAILDLEVSKQTTPSSQTYLCHLEEESWPWKDPEHRLPTTHVHHDYCITALFQRSTHKERQRQKSAHTHTLTGIYTHTRGERQTDREKEKNPTDLREEQSSMICQRIVHRQYVVNRVRHRHAYPSLVLPSSFFSSLSPLLTALCYF
jgi:hypothetical protein